MKVGRGYIPFIGRLVSEGPFMIGMDTLIRHKSLFSTNIQVALRPQYVKHRISNPEVGNSVELGSARSPRTGLVELFLWTYFGTTELRRIAILGGSSSYLPFPGEMERLVGSRKIQISSIFLSHSTSQKSYFIFIFSSSAV